jgi:hypothetical protein
VAGGALGERGGQIRVCEQLTAQSRALRGDTPAFHAEELRSASVGARPRDGEDLRDGGDPRVREVGRRGWCGLAVVWHEGAPSVVV